MSPVATVVLPTPEAVPATTMRGPRTGTAGVWQASVVPVHQTRRTGPRFVHEKPAAELCAAPDQDTVTVPPTLEGR